jgi:hypothetical protein
MRETGSKFNGRTCAECLKWGWDSDGVMGRDRKKYDSVEQCRKVTGKDPWERAKGVQPPCYECPKIPDDAPEKSYYYAIEITLQTYLTIQYNDECEAVGDYPKDPRTGQVDPIVRKNAAIIKNIRRAVRQNDQIKAMASMFSVSGMSASG